MELFEGKKMEYKESVIFRFGNVFPTTSLTFSTTGYMFTVRTTGSTAVERTQYLLK